MPGLPSSCGSGPTSSSSTAAWSAASTPRPTKAAVIKAFVGFANDTGALICAEGIETVAELNRVTELGAAMGQGYLLGRPQAQWVQRFLTGPGWRPHRGNGRVVQLRPACIRRDQASIVRNSSSSSSTWYPGRSCSQ